MWNHWEGWERYINEEWKHIYYVYIEMTSTNMKQKTKNRVYHETDYEQVIERLEKRAKEEKRIKTRKSEEP